MRIGICTHYTPDWQELADITIPVLEKYCEKHGYDINVLECYKYEKYDGLEKIHQAQEFLKYNDYILIVDADTMVMDFTIKIEDLIDSEHELFICQDFHGLNAGVFILKNSDWSNYFLKYLTLVIGSKNIHCEQDAIKEYILRFGDNKIKYLPQRKLNNYLYELYPDLAFRSDEKSFILHLPGLPIKKRIEVFTEKKNEIIYE